MKDARRPNYESIATPFFETLLFRELEKKKTSRSISIQMNRSLERLSVIKGQLTIDDTHSNTFTPMETAAKSENITLSCHSLDTTLGIPAKGMPVRLQRKMKKNGTTLLAKKWETISDHETNADGRIRDFSPLSEAGTYKMIFDTAEYFKKTGILQYFYPQVKIVFTVEPGQHYHIPLLISPYGYSTYRGS